MTCTCVGVLNKCQGLRFTHNVDTVVETYRPIELQTLED